jgi:hypothetical protein
MNNVENYIKFYSNLFIYQLCTMQESGARASVGALRTRLPPLLKGTMSGWPTVQGEAPTLPVGDPEELDARSQRQPLPNGSEHEEERAPSGGVPADNDGDDMLEVGSGAEARARRSAASSSGARDFVQREVPENESLPTANPVDISAVQVADPVDVDDVAGIPTPIASADSIRRRRRMLGSLAALLLLVAGTVAGVAAGLTRANRPASRQAATGASPNASSLPAGQDVVPTPSPTHRQCDAEVAAFNWCVAPSGAPTPSSPSSSAGCGACLDAHIPTNAFDRSCSYGRYLACTAMDECPACGDCENELESVFNCANRGKCEAFDCDAPTLLLL